ncbi:MocR-like transcription factor YczR [Rathayibacter soli]|uniref:MocR-like transcription factor YczR n=1 Tax=Rathayibacter soli TaxID=3144168 RepID=UPI0027E4C67F|nr:PLP-dependent aminotransferase family protein [Glaciibacter superstes]
MAVELLTARALDVLLGEWRGPGPAYEALADRIRLLVLDGRVAIGARLPAERELAERMALSRTTVAAAYRRLRERGFASSLRGSGTLTRLPSSAPLQHASLGDALLDFTKAAPPAPHGLAAAARAATEDLPAFLGDSGYDQVGLPVLREAIARRYEQRGVATEPDQILVTVGAQQAIALIARTLLSRGDRVLIETPTYPHAYEALRDAGGRLVGVPVLADFGPADFGPADPGSPSLSPSPSPSPRMEAAADAGAIVDGWDMAALEAAIRRTSPVLAYVMPDFQNPTGRSMSPALRARLLEVAAGQGTLVVADETTAELNIDRAGRFLPLPAYATGNHSSVLLIGSASKSLWGGLRIGWIRAETSMIRRLAAVRSGIDLGTPILEQLIVARLLPDAEQIQAERAQRLAAGRDAVEDELARAFPGWDVPRVHGGLAAWVNIGVPMSSALALAARNHGLLITAGPRFGIDGAFERFLRVPITGSADHVQRAVSALTRSWPGLAQHPLPDPAYLAAVV